MILIMKYYLILTLFLISSVHATVYRSVDSQGNVSYSDVESEQAEEITIDIAPSYIAPPPPVDIPEADVFEQDQQVSPKYKITLTSPTQNQTLQNPESISVVASISPELNSKREDRVIFKLDGKRVGPPQVALTASLAGVERGSHILLVSVIDKSGKVLKSSKSVLFHVQRRSVAN